MSVCGRKFHLGYFRPRIIGKQKKKKEKNYNLFRVCMRNHLTVKYDNEKDAYF